jgi:cytochrome oxidase assembly protein ShyY1
VARARFLLRPRWLLSHLFVLALVVLMVVAGFWQLDRLGQRRDRNALVEDRTELPAVPVDELVVPGDGGDQVDEVRFRRVTAEGTYDADATVVVRNRSQDGRAGGWLVTPMVLASGDRVGVIRGFVGLDDDSTIPEVAPPEGDVTVAGLAMDPARLGGTSERDLEGLLAEDDVLPAVVQAYSSEPADAGPAAAGADDAAPSAGDAVPSPAAEEAGLVVVPAPELSEGPHLGYAAQWFIFATIGAVGYPLALRRIVQRREAEGDGSDDGDDEDGPTAERDGADDAATAKAEGGAEGEDDVDAELRELLRGGG